jgi:hypothetical protein
MRRFGPHAPASGRGACTAVVHPGSSFPSSTTGGFKKTSGNAQTVTQSKDSQRKLSQIRIVQLEGMMGSLLETYRRQRDLRNFLRTQELTIASQLCAVDGQVKRLLHGHDCQSAELARSVYLHHYLVGILDAITSFYERETRRRLGLELFRDVFVRYLRDRFFVPQPEADALFATIGEHPQHPGMRDGYLDGLQALRGGKPPRRLLDWVSVQARPADMAQDGMEFALAASA